MPSPARLASCASAQQGGNTYVEGDLNGDGLGDVFLALTGTITLEVTDFVL